MDLTKEESFRRGRVEALRLDMILRLKKEKRIEVRILENLFCYRHGVSKRTFREYLDIALTLAAGKIEGGFIIKND